MGSATRFGTRLDDIWNGPGSLFYGICTLKIGSRDEERQFGGPGAQLDSQKGVQETMEDKSLAAQRILTRFWRTFGTAPGACSVAFAR